MKKHYIFSIIVLSIISTTSVLATNAMEIDKIKYTQNEVIVKYKKGISIEKAKSLSAAKNLKTSKAYKTLSAKNNQAFVVIQGDISTEMLIKQLKEDPNVESVSPNYIRTLSKLPNDPRFEELWGLNNTGQEVHGETGIANVDINAPEAWETTTGSKNIVVAVLDTGVDYNHQDLVGNMWNNLDDPIDGEDNDGNGYIDDYYGIDVAADSAGTTTDGDPMDIDGHGTHVAGTIGADGNNTIGSTGVNWDVGIMAIKVFRPSDNGELGAHDIDILDAIDYVLEKKTAGVIQ
jgi:subtilisin family serine protease